MSNNQKGKKRELDYANYKSQKRQEINRKAKLERLLKRFPNNEQLVKALKDVHYRRGTPKTETWLQQEISTAQLMKYFTGKFSREVFSADPKVAHAACCLRNENKFKNFDNAMPKGSMFAMGLRAHDGNGNLVWK